MAFLPAVLLISWFNAGFQFPRDALVEHGTGRNKWRWIRYFIQDCAISTELSVLVSPILSSLMTDKSIRRALEHVLYIKSYIFKLLRYSNKKMFNCTEISVRLNIWQILNMRCIYKSGIISWLSIEELKSSEYKFSIKILKYNYDKNL